MALVAALKRINNTYGLEDAFGAKDITSEAMRKAILTWYGLYYDFDGDDKFDPAQRVPYIIVDGLHKAAFGEYEVTAGAKEDANTLTAMLATFGRVTASAFQQAAIGGEVLIKPLIKREGVGFTVIGRGNMIVLGRDAEGDITDVVTGALTVKGTKHAPSYYWLVERRTLEADGTCTVQNKLYQSESKDSIGRSVPMSSLPEYAGLPSSFTFPEAMGGLGLIPVRIPAVNCVDGSPDGVSVYAAATQEIIKLYSHEVRAQDEYDLTAPHLVASRDIQQRGIDGRLLEIPKYITPFLDDDPKDAGLTAWNPKPNQAELEARDDQIKRAIENIIGLRRGFLSKSDVQEFTATEIVSTTTKMAHLIKDLQSMWDGVVQDTVRVCGVLAHMYGLPWVDSEVTTSWGDGILYDEEKEFNRLSVAVARGEIMPEYLIDWMGIKPLDPGRIAEIRKQFMPAETQDEKQEGDEI